MIRFRKLDALGEECSRRLLAKGFDLGPKRTRALRRVYKGGNAYWFDDVDADGFCEIEVSRMIKELGYKNLQMKFHYKKSTFDLDKCLEPLRANIDVLDMLSYVHKFKLMKVFIEHPIDTFVIDIYDEEDSNDIGNANIGLGKQESDDLGNANVSLGIEESHDLGTANVGLGSGNAGLGRHKYKSIGTNNVDDVNVGLKKIMNDNVEDVNVGLGNDNVGIECSDNSEDHDDSEDSDFECDVGDQINDVHVDMEIEIDSDEDEAERRKALKKLAKCHKPIDVVEYENKQSWLWFLDCLGDDLELFRNSNFTFCTDRQKGIIPALVEIVEHRFATTTIVSLFNKNIKELKGASIKQTVIGLKGQAYHYMLRVYKRVPHEKDCHSPTDSPIILTPPDYHTPIGRTSKKRMKSVGELYDEMLKDGKLSRTDKTVTCIKCGEKGHNSRSCKGERGSQSTARLMPSQGGSQSS
ncbi:transposase, MuDR [Tanacetum coccineum]|uniref:Transposase, MuDR n=1 Tax=Tanacetum coccineum TaxID=301880 RepID=A0ABQ5GS22_9ASTR